MFDEIQAKLIQLRMQAEKNSFNELSKQAAEITQALKAIEEHDFHDLRNNFSGLIKLSVDVYDAIGWELRELNKHCAENKELKHALSDSIQFYKRLSNFLQTVFNTPVITKKLIHDTQKKLEVDPNYLPNALPGYLSEPKIGETHAAFERRRMAEHMQARIRGQTIGLSAIRQNELEYKSAIKFVDTQIFSNHANPEVQEYVTKHIAAKYLDTYRFIVGYNEQISWKSKTPEKEVLSISLKEFADRVQYYDDQERTHFRKFIYDGKVYERDLASQDVFAAKPTDTTHKSSKGVANYAAFVINSRGEFYAETHLSHDFDGSKADIFRFHSSFTSGSYVISAGEIKTSPTGQLLAITNRSGHYHPKLYNLYNAYRFLKDKGIDFSNCAFEYILHTPDGREIPSKLTEETFLNYFRARSQDLYNAILNNDKTTVQALLKEGAVLSEQQQKDLKTDIQLYLDELLQVAFNENDYKAVDQHLNNGAQFHFQPRDIAVLHAAAKSKELLEVLHKHNFSLNYQDQNGDTALHIAVAAGNQPAFGFLMNHGLNPLQPNNEGLTPVKIASSANLDLVGNAGIAIEDQENDIVDIPPPPLDPVKTISVNFEGEEPFDPRYSALLHDSIMMLIAQSKLPSAGFLSDFLNAAVNILNGNAPLAELPTKNKAIQQEYTKFIDIISKIHNYIQLDSIEPNFVAFRQLIAAEHEKFSAVAKITSPHIQAELLGFDYDESNNKYANDNIDPAKLVMSCTSAATLHSELTKLGFIIDDPDSNHLDNIFVEIKRNQAIGNIHNQTLKKILAQKSINIDDEKVNAINKFLTDPNLKHSTCDSVLVNLLGVKSFFITEAQFKDILREIKTEHLKKFDIHNQDAIKGVQYAFIKNADDITNASQAFKQQRRPNIFRSKVYNLDRLYEIAKLLTQQIFGLDDYHKTIEKIKLIQGSDFALSDISKAAIHQHEKELRAFETQLNDMVKLTVNELINRVTKLVDLAKTLQQRFAKNQKTDKLIASWEEQKPLVAKILALQEQLNALITHYDLDAKTKVKLINHLRDLAGANATLSELVEQVHTANKQKEEQNKIELTVVSAPAVQQPASIIHFEKQAGKPEQVEPQSKPAEVIKTITTKPEIVRVTDKLSYQMKNNHFSYVRPKDYSAPFISKAKTYTAEEKLVFEDMSRRLVEGLKEKPLSEIKLNGNNAMGRKLAIWITARQPDLKISINGNEFKPSFIESREINQKHAAEKKRQQSGIANKRNAMELTHTEEHTPLLLKKRN